MNKPVKIMRLPKISASVVLAAACSAAVTCAFQLAYNMFSNTRMKCKNCSVKRASRRKEGSKLDSQVKEGHLPENFVEEIIVSGHENQWYGVLEQHQNDDGTTEMGESCRSNNDIYIEATVTDDGLTKAFGGETDNENLKGDNVLQVC